MKRPERISYLFLKIDGTFDFCFTLHKKIESLYNSGFQVPINSSVIIENSIYDMDLELRIVWSKSILETGMKHLENNCYYFKLYEILASINFNE